MKKYEEKLLSINWFSRTGELNMDNLDDFSIRFEHLKTKLEMERRIESQRWENKRIEEQNKVTFYLFKNQREKYKLWNV